MGLIMQRLRHSTVKPLHHSAPGIKDQVGGEADQDCGEAR